MNERVPGLFRLWYQHGFFSPVSVRAWYQCCRIRHWNSQAWENIAKSSVNNALLSWKSYCFLAAHHPWKRKFLCSLFPWVERIFCWIPRCPLLLSLRAVGALIPHPVILGKLRLRERSHSLWGPQLHPSGEAYILKIIFNFGCAGLHCR